MEIKVKFKWIFLTLFFACAIPFSASAATNATLPPEGPNIDEVRAKNGTYNFRIYAAEGEIKPSSNDHYTLTLTAGKNKKGQDMMVILYQEDAPKNRQGNVSLSAFQKYFEKGGSFEKVPPNAGLEAAVNRKEKATISYDLNLKSMTYDGNKVVFDVVPLKGGKPMNISGPKKLYKIEITVDDIGGSGY